MFKYTIDDTLNRFLWPNQVHRFPKAVGRFLGGSKPKPVADYWTWLEVLVATFCGIAVIEAVFKSQTVFTDHHAPLIIASYGASAILCFNVQASPLGQPRNVIMGQFLSSLIGICIQKLFSLSAGGVENYWLGGALSVALSSVVMSVFNCVHPPGGASALLPCVEEGIRAMSWWYLPAQLISSVLMLAVACIFGNLTRSYPVFWWSAGVTGRSSSDDSETIAADSISLVSSHNSEFSRGIRYVDGLSKIEIAEDFINVPRGMQLGSLEEEWMSSLQNLLSKFEKA